MEQHIEKLEEYIKDEDTIVTIPSLATRLNVSIQESQKILAKYVELYEKSGDIHVSYVLNGTLKNGSGAVFLVKQTDLDEKKSRFSGDLRCCVYSIQKSPNIDFNVLTLVDKYSEGKTRAKALAGSIISKNCVKRTLKLKKLPPPPAPTLKGKSSFFTKQSSDKSSEKIVNEKPQESNAKSKQGGIAAMFTKAASSGTLKKSDEKVSTKSSPKPSGKISGFFTKSTSSNGTLSKNSSIKSEDSIKTEEIVDELMDIDFSEDFKEDEDHKTEPESPRNENKTVTDKPTGEVKVRVKVSNDDFKKNDNKEKRAVGKGEKKKKRNRSRSEEKNTTKRRKRIIVRDDSDSDDIFKSEESEHVVESSDEETPEKLPPVTVKKPLVPKNKKRIAVDKTYKDEEGFVVTKVEYEYVSASEDEERVKEPVKTEEKKTKILEKKISSNSENDENPVKTATKGKKGKKPASSGTQPTLMNFFKKK